MQWRLDMKDTVRTTITGRYAGKGDVTDSDKTDVPFYVCRYIVV